MTILMTTGPLFVSSGDLLADRRYRWALEHAARGDFAAAVDVLAQTVELAPGFATAWFALGAMRERLGDHDGAVVAFAKARDADPEDYHGGRLQLHRLGAGELLPEMTAVYVRRLFDQHAPEFDRSLTERLGYRGPALLLDAVQRACAVTGRTARFDAMLDLGCGTGLAGTAFRPHVARMTGVDLSSQMVGRAEGKGIYDRLETEELNTFLRGQIVEGVQYDLVVAADVFVYMADLAGACTRIRQVLAPDGVFAFTVETHAGAGMVLRETLRYAHAREHVGATLAAAGLVLLVEDSTSIRAEKGVPVSSLTIVAGRTELVG
jgi:predicted TPR repeat methyltransferase